MLDRLRITIIRSSRKTLALRVTGPDSAEVRAPRLMPKSQIDAFVRQKEGWLQKHLLLAAQRQQEAAAQPPLTQQDIRALCEQAKADLPPRAAFFASLLGVSYGRITIRKQKTRWGSCSGKGNLNFNCLLMLCPSRARDYVVAHELCHRKEMNHSPRFWALVERAMPDYRVWRQWLKEEGQKIIRRI